MTQLAVETLLRQRTGLDATIFTSDLLAKAVQHRMVEHRITEISIYLGLLRHSAQELEALVEAVVVPETWFFRDKEPFVLLKQFAHAKGVRSEPNHVLRVLSLPCSTGEEPYSIAIALLEAGLSAEQFQIDAVDISRRALRVAQQGIYSSHSFRGTDPTFQQRYFTRISTGTLTKYCLRESVRKSVNFQHGNVIDSAFAENRLPYDIIFCRNLLIYFDGPSRERTLHVIHQLLRPEGLLFVGHAETGLISATHLPPVQHPFAFAFRKAPRPCPSVPPSIYTASLSHAAGRLQHVGDRPTSPAKHASTSAHPQIQPSRELARPEHPIRPPASLSAAQRLANQGHLRDAAQQCQAYLNQHRTSAEAYVLLGQVHQAMGQELQAEQCFQKAIYLNPKHLDALIHLALLLEQQDDTSGAATIRQRIQRLKH